MPVFLLIEQILADREHFDSSTFPRVKLVDVNFFQLYSVQIFK